jgi:hypothetical protein
MSPCGCRRFPLRHRLPTPAAVKALRERFDADGIEVVEWL